MKNPQRNKTIAAGVLLPLGLLAVYLSLGPASPSPAPKTGRMAVLESESSAPGLTVTRKGRSAASATIDPTLRLDLLAKVREVKYEGAERNIFQFYTPPPAPPTPVQPVLVYGPQEPPKPPVPPPPPPIPLKFYGFAAPAGAAVRRAFFQDGEDFHVVYEGDVIKKRYKVLKINPSNVEMEDLETKSKQRLPLLET